MVNVENSPNSHFSTFLFSNVHSTQLIQRKKSIFRLKDVKEAYFSYNITEDGVVEAYSQWVNQPDYLMLRKISMNIHTYEMKSKYVFVKCSKRGNDVYVYRVKKRFLKPIYNTDKTVRPMISKMGNLYISNVLFVTLTFNRCFDLWDVWRGVGECVNQLLKYFREYLHIKNLYVIRIFEAHDDYYPHVHLVLLSKDKIFEGFEYNGVIRAEDHIRDAIQNFWGNGFVDVFMPKNVSHVRDYVLKYVTKSLVTRSSDKSLKTMAMSWIFQKRLFAYSRYICVGDTTTDVFKKLHIEICKKFGKISNCDLWNDCLYYLSLKREVAFQIKDLLENDKRFYVQLDELKNGDYTVMITLRLDTSMHNSQVDLNGNVVWVVEWYYICIATCFGWDKKVLEFDKLDKNIRENLIMRKKHRAVVRWGDVFN